MKWLTISRIKRRSKTAKGALKVSYEHWCQLYDATAKELRIEFKRTDEELNRGDYCGLCTYHRRKQGRNWNYCDDCIFGDFCECNLWMKANCELLDWYDKDHADWHSWKRACKAVRDKLGELLKPS